MLVDPWVEKTLWGRAWQPTPVFLPGESHGQGSLADYRPWGQKESNVTERLCERDFLIAFLSDKNNCFSFLTIIVSLYQGLIFLVYV